MVMGEGKHSIYLLTGNHPDWKPGDKFLKQKNGTRHPFPGDLSDDWVECFREIGDKKIT